MKVHCLYYEVEHLNQVICLYSGEYKIFKNSDACLSIIVCVIAPCDSSSPVAVGPECTFLPLRIHILICVDTSVQPPTKLRKNNLNPVPLLSFSIPYILCAE